MNKKDLAAQLNGRKMGEEITRDEERVAKLNDLVVIYGASDDLLELAGAISDEISGYNDTTALFHDGDLYTRQCGDDDCPHEEKIQDSCKSVKGIFGAEGFSWTYETSIPHETFEIFDGTEKYCRGIVFSITDIQ